MNKKQKREYMRKWRKDHPGVQAKRSKEWREKNPERWKAIKRKYWKNNKEKIYKQQRKYNKNHREQIREYGRKWYKKWRSIHPYKIAKPGNGWKPIRDEVLKRDNHSCQICRSKKNVEVHHIDGTGSNLSAKEMNNGKENLITLCHKCHMLIEVNKVGDFSRGKWQEDKKRDMAIYKLSEKIPQSHIAKEMGLSRQRINQIVVKYRSKLLTSY